MKKSLCAVIFSGMMFSLPVYALEAMNDAQMSQQTGQDGLVIQTSGDGLLGVKKMRYIDKSGFTSGSIVNNNPGAISLNAPSDPDPNKNKIRFCTDAASATCTLDTGKTTITMDTDGGNASNGSTNNAFVNVAITGSAKSYFIPENTTLSLLGGSVNATTGRVDLSTATEKEIVKFTEGIKITKDNVAKINIQLGNQPQGHMILVGENVVDIEMGGVELVSHNTNIADSKITTNVVITDFEFSGIGIDVSGTDGVVLDFGQETKIDELKVTDTVLGSTSGAVDANVFNGLNNASIGNIGATDINIKNLQVNVKGM